MYIYIVLLATHHHAFSLYLRFYVYHTYAHAFFFFVRRKITGMYIIYIYMYKYNERGVQTRRAFWPFYPYYLALGRTFCVRRAH